MNASPETYAGTLAVLRPRTELAAYRAGKNSVSIDGRPALDVAPAS